MVLGQLSVPGRPIILMIVGQGPIALAVGAGGGCLDILTPLSFLFLSLSGRRLVGDSISVYIGPSPKEREKEERKGQMRVKMSKQPPSAPTTSAVGPCPTVIQIVGCPSTGSSPSTIAPSDHPHWETARYRLKYCLKGPLNPKQPTNYCICFCDN